jgi:hypothetical protein
MTCRETGGQQPVQAGGQPWLWSSGLAVELCLEPPANNGHDPELLVCIYSVLGPQGTQSGYFN